MMDNSEYCINVEVSFEELQENLCIDCIHYDSLSCICSYDEED